MPFVLQLKSETLFSLLIGSMNKRVQPTRDSGGKNTEKDSSSSLSSGRKRARRGPPILVHIGNSHRLEVLNRQRSRGSASGNEGNLGDNTSFAVSAADSISGRSSLAVSSAYSTRSTLWPSSSSSSSSGTRQAQDDSLQTLEDMSRQPGFTTPTDSYP